jgi:CHAT domain-containing protein
VERQLLEKLGSQSGLKRIVTLSGTEATTARLRQELEQARFAHIATHSFVAEKRFRSFFQLDETLFAGRHSVNLSGLVCAGANLPGTPEQGILSADAVAGLLLGDLQLAVLSASETGRGDGAGGAGVSGLQHAFHLAGTRNVVASLWSVDDTATVALMNQFYRYLWEDKQPPIEALRRAQLDLYRNPQLIPKWAKGERVPGSQKPASTATMPKEKRTDEGLAPVRLWAAFTLSGHGHFAPPGQSRAGPPVTP